MTLPILVGFLLFTKPGVAADGSSGTNGTRWGITTKVAVEEEVDVKEKGAGKDAGVNNNPKGKLNDKNMLRLEDDLGAGGPEGKDVAGPKGTIKEKSDGKKSLDRRQSDAISTEKPKDFVEKEPREKSKNLEAKEALIKWENERQKTKCNEYLASLKELFLKARYYSIQGVPCGTGENARKFMSQIDQCRRDCPDGFLRRSGYTKRIIRNLSWLEKLGAERCPDMDKNLPQTYTDPHRRQSKEME